jgi:hypothetical protein
MSLEIDGFDTDHASYIPSTTPFLNDTDAKVTLVANRVKGEGEIGINASWGDGKGITYGVYGNVEAKDTRGNSAQIKAKQNSDGTGSISASAKKKFDTRPRNK